MSDKLPAAYFSPLFILADNPLGIWWESAGALEKTALILLGGVLVHIVFRMLILRGLNKLAHATENDLDDRLVHFIRRFYALGLMFALVMMILSANNIEITPLLASAGIVGIAIGLAAKETLADILAGIFLIVDRPMRMGDRIKIERIGDHWGSWGDVVDIGLRRTQIRNTDGVIVNYPNNTLASSVITNFSFEDKPVRVRVRFQVNYDADLEVVSDLARKAIHACEGVLPDSADIVIRSVWDDSGGHNLGGVLVEGRYRIADVRERTRIRSRVLAGIVKHLRAGGVDFATQSIELRGGAVEP